MKKGLIGFWLAIVILSVAAWPGERAAAQTPDLQMCWEDQVARVPGIGITSSPTNITLVSFCIEYYDADDQVLVTWETGTEIDTAGFYIQRYEQQSGTYPRISEFIYSLSIAPPAGAIYEYEDDTAELGKIYYYKLEEIDINNVSVSLTGPVAFDFYSPTATPTTTPTVTRTPTPTSTAPTSTPTYTRTATATSLPRTPTRTRPPATTSASRSGSLAQVVTPTPTANPVPSETLPVSEGGSTEIITATATLEPLPPVMLLFPAPTVTPVPSVVMVTAEATIVAMLAEKPFDVEMQAQFSNRVKLLGSIILVLWIVLGGFLIIYLRKASGHH